MATTPCKRGREISYLLWTSLYQLNIRGLSLHKGEDRFREATGSPCYPHHPKDARNFPGEVWPEKRWSWIPTLLSKITRLRRCLGTESCRTTISGVGGRGACAGGSWRCRRKVSGVSVRSQSQGPWVCRDRPCSGHRTPWRGRGTEDAGAAAGCHCSAVTWMSMEQVSKCDMGAGGRAGTENA